MREGMSPVGSPGLSWIFAGLQKSTTPRTPSGPRLALQAAGPSTRPDEAGVTFPRCDTHPGVASGRRFDDSLNSSFPLTHIVPFFLPPEWEGYRFFSCPLPLNHDRVGKKSHDMMSTLLCARTELVVNLNFPPAVRCGKECRPWEVLGCRGFLQARKIPRPPGPRPVHALLCKPRDRPPALMRRGSHSHGATPFPALLPAGVGSFITLVVNSHFAYRVVKKSVLFMPTPSESIDFATFNRQNVANEQAIEIWFYLPSPAQAHGFAPDSRMAQNRMTIKSEWTFRVILFHTVIASLEKR